MVQLTPLPPHHLCCSKIQNGLSVWYRPTTVVPDKVCKMVVVAAAVVVVVVVVVAVAVAVVAVEVVVQQSVSNLAM